MKFVEAIIMSNTYLHIIVLIAGIGRYVPEILKNNNYSS